METPVRGTPTVGIEQLLNGGPGDLIQRAIELYDASPPLPALAQAKAPIAQRLFDRLFDEVERDGERAMSLDDFRKRIRDILSAGGHIDQTHSFKHVGTLLCLTAATGTPEYLKSLLCEFKASSMKANRYGWLPLHHAVHEGNEDCARFLRRNGDVESITTANKQGNHPALLTTFKEK